MTNSARIIRDGQVVELVVYDDNWKRNAFTLSPDQLVMLLESATRIIWGNYDLVPRKP